MKKKNFISLFGGVFFMIALALFALPEQTDADGINQQYVATQCIGADISFACNDCKSGTKTCWDNTCAECRPEDPVIN